MKKSCSSPTLNNLCSGPTLHLVIPTTTKKMHKSVSCNALSDMAVISDAAKFIPLHHAIHCVSTGLVAHDMSVQSLGACMASPPDLVDDHHFTKSLSERYRAHVHSERFQTLFDIVRRKKRATSASNQKLMDDKENDP